MHGQQEERQRGSRLESMPSEVFMRESAETPSGAAIAGLERRGTLLAVLVVNMLSMPGWRLVEESGTIRGIRRAL